MKNLELTYYSVTSHGAIIVPDILEPKIRADVFEQVDLMGVHSRQELILLIDACQPLARHFRDLSLSYLDAHTQAPTFLDKLGAQRSQRLCSEQLILEVLRRDPEEGWQKWIDYSGDSGLEGFLQSVRDWLHADIDWNECEHFDVMWNGQAAARAYFEDLPCAILKALGVRIIDGDVPGSTYRAAELLKGIDEANEIAELLELDFRFEAAKTPCVESSS